ncbi:MAG: hypothetical protein KF729_35960, partial [Sandaracinaceae bacterium]|nr:hypothetical protein [Sandaracinaceae bacterium]
MSSLRSALSLCLGLALAGPSAPVAAQCSGGAPNGNLTRPPEQCDDDNTVAGDGCSPTCQIEAGWICAQPVDFMNLTALQYAGGNASWTFSADGYSATQTVNTTTPTFAYFGADATRVTYTFDLRVGTTTDDDFIGFVLGFDPGDVTDPMAEYLLLDWKRANQGCGTIGMALSRVTGIPSVAPTTTSNFWCHTGGVSELARAATYGATGWIPNRTYRFEITYSLTRVTVRVTDQTSMVTTLAFDQVGTFPPGQIGFYGFSQPNVTYTIVGPRGPSLCNRPPEVPDVTQTVPHATGGRCFDVVSGATDPDGDGIDGASVRVVASGAGVTATDPSSGAPAGQVCLVPASTATTQTFVTTVRVCDDRPLPQACTEMTLTVTFEAPCAGASAGDACTDLGGAAGTCRGTGATLSCCTGCWTGTTCAAGTGVANCGASGALCASCNDGNACTTDACAAGACSNTARPAGATCPAGVCTGASVMCVACIADAQCGGATPRCDTTTNTCVGCLADGDCGGATPRCDPMARACVECVGAADCNDGVECTTDVCFGGACMNPTRPAGDPCSSGVCSGAGAMCVGCLDDSHCPGTTRCDTAARTCVGCITAADCEDGNECTTHACTASACSTTPVAEGTACSAGICDVNTMCSAVAVDITAPADGSTVSTATPTIRGTATPGATVTVTVDGVVVGTVVAAADGTWSLTLTTPLAEGSHMASASITTPGGSAMDTVTFTVATGGFVTITEPADGSTTREPRPTIRGRAPPGATVVVRVDGEEVGTVTADGDGNWSLPLEGDLEDGEHVVEATATDGEGRTGTDTSTFTVDTETSVTIDSVSESGVITGTGEPGSTVVVTIDGEEVGTAMVGADGRWSLDTGRALEPGEHTVTATSTDPAGNTATDTRVVIITPGADGGGVGADGGA